MWFKKVAIVSLALLILHTSIGVVQPVKMQNNSNFTNEKFISEVTPGPWSIVNNNG